MHRQVWESSAFSADEDVKWRDARIDPQDRDASFRHDVLPVVATPEHLQVLDAEGATPIVCTGSANMSRNSEQYNDENLLEFRDARIAAIYLAEFLPRYEHYRARARARALSIETKRRGAGTQRQLALAPDSSWAKKYYLAGSVEEKARIALAATAPTD